MDFITATKTGFRKFAEFKGRAQRSEYWYFTLFSFLVQVSFGILDGAMGTPFAVIAALVLLLPGIAVTVRRLHDLDKSGWWFLLVFIPLLGPIVLIYWECQKGTAGSNRFGDDPLGGGEPLALPA